MAFQRTLYDLEAAAQQIRASGFPGADAFGQENVLRPPLAAEATKFFETLAAGRDE